MTVTSELDWLVDGTSIMTLAKNVETRGGTSKPAPFRGEDIVIPYRTGQQWQSKTPDSKSLPLKMWVRGCDDDGVIPATGTAQRALYDQNLSDLLRLFWNEGRQINLTKKFYENGVVRSATALAEFSDGFDTSMIGRTLSRFTVDLKLADPFFYDDDATLFTLVNGDNTITLPGHARTTAVNVIINGSRNDTIVRNKTLGMQVEYAGNLNVGQAANIDCHGMTATQTPAGSPTFYPETLVKHSGSPLWLQLAPGENIINLSSTSGAGVVQLQTRGAWH